MANSTATTESGKWKISIPHGTVNAGSTDTKTLTILTAGKYADRDIIVESTATAQDASGTSAATLSASGTGSATVPVTIGAKSGSSYPFSGTSAISGEAIARVTTPGYAAETLTGTGSVSGTADVSGSVAAIGLSASGTGSATVAIADSNVGTLASGKYSISSTGAISGTASASVSSTGYGVKGVETGTGSVSGTATASGNLTKLTMTAGSTTVSSNVATMGEYKVTTSGYMKTGDATTIANGKLPAATFSNTASSGVTYVDVSDAKIGSASGSAVAPVLKSGDFLYINRGYVDNMKISLAKLVPDEADAGADLTSNSMLSGYTAYNNDGKLITGTIASKTQSDLSASASGKTVTATVPAGYYASESTVSASVANAGAATTVPTAVTTEVTVGSTATSGYYPVSNTVGATSSHASAGWVTTTAETGSASIQVGKIAQSSISPATGTYTANNTLDKNTGVKISAGYYPTDRYIKAKDYSASDFASGNVELAKQTGTSVVGKSTASVRDAAASLTGNNITDTITISEPISGQYTITASGSTSISANVTTAGWIDNGDIAAKSVTSSGTKTIAEAGAPTIGTAIANTATWKLTIPVEVAAGYNNAKKTANATLDIYSGAYTIAP